MEPACNMEHRIIRRSKMERPVDRTGQSFPMEKETAHSRLSARYLRKEFSISKPIKRATVFICGLGLYELFINGQHIGNQVLTPAPTDYRKTVLYNTSMLLPC